MRNELEKIAKIEKFLNGELTERESNEFREEIRLNSELNNEVEKQRLIQEGIQSLFLKKIAHSAYRKFKIIRFLKYFGIPSVIIITTVMVINLINNNEGQKLKLKSNGHPQLQKPFYKSEPIPKTDSVVSFDTTSNKLNTETKPSEKLDFFGPLDDIFIEAENYIDFKDLSPENLGNVSSNDPVDLYNLSGRTVVGHTLPEEWLKFNFDIPKAGDYELYLMVGSGKDSVDRTINFNVNEKLWKTINPPFTGSWLDYKALYCGKYKFKKGKQQTLKLDFKTGWINLDKVIIRYSKDNF